MSTFHFKQFSVQIEKSAMKVNTDSVLLGGWTKITEDAKQGLDIGSGTGILSLMMAQKSSNLYTIGLEIEHHAFIESKLNFENSIWNKRLRAVNLPLQDFETEVKFDLIISNPPYFINDLKNQSDNKTQARHTDSLSFEELIDFAEIHLSETGTFNLILPKIESELFIELSKTSRLYLQEIAFIRPNSNKDINRVLMKFGKERKELISETFSVYKAQGVYSDRHYELTKDFYLDK